MWPRKTTVEMIPFLEKKEVPKDDMFSRIWTKEFRILFNLTNLASIVVILVVALL